MKNMCVLLLSLFAITFGLCGNAMAEPLAKERVVDTLPTDVGVETITRTIIYIPGNPSTYNCSPIRYYLRKINPILNLHFLLGTI